MNTARTLLAAALVAVFGLTACGDADDPAGDSTAQPDMFISDVGNPDPEPDAEPTPTPDPQPVPDPMDTSPDPEPDTATVDADMGDTPVKDPDVSTEDASEDMPDADPEPEPDPEPDMMPTSHLNIDVLGALLGPGKSDRSQWDGIGNVPDELWLTVAVAVQLPVHDVLDFLSQTTVQSLSKPDPYGTVELDLGQGWEQPRELSPRTNTFQPLFDNASYVGIPSEAQLRMKIELWDEDVALDDPVGSVIISKEVMLEAVETGGSTWVNVAGQSNGQIIFIQIAVAEFDN